MNRVFETNTTFTTYFVNYLRLIGPFVCIWAFLLALKIYLLEEFQNSLGISFAIIVATPILIVLGAILNFKLRANVRYEFSDKEIIVIKNGRTRHYSLAALKKVVLVKENKNTLLDHISIVFDNNSRLRFSIVTPYYFELKKYLVKFLIDTNTSHFIRYK